MTRARPFRFIALAAVVVLAAVALPHASPARAASSWCTTDPCSGWPDSPNDVGPFFAGISQACGNEGTCSLADIETVFANTGNYVLALVGSLVFFAYVVGGFYFLISGMPGMEKYREKGKTALKLSTVGLVVVFVAYAGLITLNNVLRGSPLGGEEYVACGPDDTNSGLACALNSTCTDNGSCVSLCEQRNATSMTTSSGSYSVGVGVSVEATVVENIYLCVDANDADNNYGLPSGYTLEGGFEKNLCPGGDNIQCGNFSLFTD